MTSTESLDEYLRANNLDPLPSGPDGAWEATFVSQLVRRTHARLRSVRETSAATRLGDPEQLADFLVAGAPLEPSPLEELTGPFYDTAGLRTWLGVRRQALDSRVRSHTLLGLQTGDRAWVYPAWQFTPDRRTIPHLTEVLRALAAGTSERWTWALWLTSPNEDWDEKPAWQWLADGGDAEPVVREAAVDAARWAA